MRMQVIGIEASSGISKAGKPYDIGQIHTIIRLAPPLGESSIAQGQMGTTYSASTDLVKTLEGIPQPFFAEADIEDFMRFGKREQMVMSIKPEKTTEKPKL